MELWSIEAIKQTVMSGPDFSVLPYIGKRRGMGKLKFFSSLSRSSGFYSHMLVKKKMAASGR